jgi:hypothetical protein
MKNKKTKFIHLGMLDKDQIIWREPLILLRELPVGNF